MLDSIDSIIIQAYINELERIYNALEVINILEDKKKIKEDLIEYNSPKEDSIKSEINKATIEIVNTMNSA